jgi:hypothetical protein
MTEYPLLDLESAWKDTEHSLQEVRDIAEHLYADSEETWTDMLTLLNHISTLHTLMILPESIAQDIQASWRDYNELADRAEAQYG